MIRDRYSMPMDDAHWTSRVWAASWFVGIMAVTVGAAIYFIVELVDAVKGMTAP